MLRATAGMVVVAPLAVFPRAANAAAIQRIGWISWVRTKSSSITAADVSDDESSSVTDSDDDESATHSALSSSASTTTSQALEREIHRLQHIRNVGIFAHVDAGKTTVTERMLALAGVVHRAGSVDDGNTVTDYLPAERERGITISSAAISFPWTWHNNNNKNSNESKQPNNNNEKENDHVTISLIDTPGHVDFSVEVNRSVAVLDGAILVVDAVAGVQAQTETVWRAMTRPSLNNHDTTTTTSTTTTTNGTCVQKEHAHEPLPCLALVNKMDKEGCHFGNAIQSIRRKLPGANPIPIQMPLFRSTKSNSQDSYFSRRNIEAISVDDVVSATGEFVGVVDLVHMRAIIYPEKSTNVSNVECCVPDVVSLMQPNSNIPNDVRCSVIQEAVAARLEFLEAMAECDEEMEEIYLTGQEPTYFELLAALRRVTLSQRGLPVMASAALRGKGVESVLDAIADLLPSPLDRQPPELSYSTDTVSSHGGKPLSSMQMSKENLQFPFGHSLNKSVLALAFKVVHMKGRGGSGDGRVVFARVYSGELHERDVIQVVSPPAPGDLPAWPRTERIGGMLELSGGRFGPLEDGVCRSGDVCALVGLKSVVTGDTIMFNSDDRASSVNKKNRKADDFMCLVGVSSPKPVLQVRLEAESTMEQKRLTEALHLLAVEDPSLVVEENESGTLLSGLGELHVEITLDRIHREFGLKVHAGTPSVSYGETVTSAIHTNGLVSYDRTIGGNRFQAAVSLVLEPTWTDSHDCMILSDPVVTVADEVKEFLNLRSDLSVEELVFKSELTKALVHGCQGAMKRGSLGSHSLFNTKCHVTEIYAEDGLTRLEALPGALRAAAINAVSTVLAENRDCCSVLEPIMSLEVTLPNQMVGAIVSDLTGSRRGRICDVLIGDDRNGMQTRAIIRGDVPLVEILGYANNLRSLSAGEAAFSAEYKGHSGVF